MNPKVTIVGRSNVGKSALFNKIIGKKTSIVEDKFCVTRDVVTKETSWRSKVFDLIDTGGIEENKKSYKKDEILSATKLRSYEATRQSDVLLFTIDAQVGITIEDLEISKQIKKFKKKVILVCNKADNLRMLQNKAHEFYSLGFEEVFLVSAIHGIGVGDLLDRVVELLPDMDNQEINPDAIKIAIVGKPNVGKSSLVNKIFGDDRMIVNEIPGTTRDSVDNFFENEFGKYILIDTAGIRKRSKLTENTEKFSVMRSFDSIDRCDVCLFMIDVNEGATEQDTKITGYGHERGKASLVILNKRDLVPPNSENIEKIKNDSKLSLKFIDYAQIISISAKTGKNVNSIFEKINYAFKSATTRIQTGLLNEVLQNAIIRHPTPSSKGKRLKIYYITQVGVKPPTFVLFVNHSSLAHFSYIRYIENKIREKFVFSGTPIKIILREKKHNF